MKCADCKYCAYIINKDDEIEVTYSDGTSIMRRFFKHAFCMKFSMSMYDVEDCAGYEKSKHKKIKPI